MKLLVYVANVITRGKGGMLIWWDNIGDTLSRPHYCCKGNVFKSVDERLHETTWWSMFHSSNPSFLECYTQIVSAGGENIS